MLEWQEPFHHGRQQQSVVAPEAQVAKRTLEVMLVAVTERLLAVRAWRFVAVAGRNYGGVVGQVQKRFCVSSPSNHPPQCFWNRWEAVQAFSWSCFSNTAMGQEELHYDALSN